MSSGDESEGARPADADFDGDEGTHTLRARVPGGRSKVTFLPAEVTRPTWDPHTLSRRRTYPTAGVVLHVLTHRRALLHRYDGKYAAKDVLSVNLTCVGCTIVFQIVLQEDPQNPDCPELTVVKLDLDSGTCLVSDFALMDSVFPSDDLHFSLPCEVRE